MAAFLRIYQIQQHPPGLHFDEAVERIISAEIAFSGARPFPVFAAFTGQEVFHFYVTALWMLGLGDHIFTGRVVSIVDNVLTVALAIGLGRAMFKGQRGMVIGLLAAGLLAVSFPQIYLARQTYRAITQPMLQAFALWTLFVGLRKSDWHRALPWLVSAGIFGGMVLYTYIASRLFPFWLGLGLVALLISERKKFRQRFGQAALVMTVLILVALPIALYFYHHQDVLFERLDQVSQGADSITYPESVILHLRMFFIKGDPFFRHNDASQPYFPLLVGLFLVAGWGVSLWQIFRAKDPVGRVGYFLIACSPLMVLPSVLAVSGLPPSHMRSVGMVPLIFFLPAVGALFVWEQFIPRIPRKALVGVGLAAVALLVMAAQVWHRYAVWASNPQLYYANDGDTVGAGEWLTDHVEGDELLYVSSLYYGHPSFMMYGLQNAKFMVGDSFFLPPAGHEAYIVDTYSAPIDPAFQPYLESAELVGEALGPDGTISYRIYRLKGENTPLPGNAETIGGWVSFRDAVLPTAIAGDSVSLVTVWNVLAVPAYNELVPKFYVETPSGNILTGGEPELRNTLEWIPGETLLVLTRLEIPPGTPPGEYPVKVIWGGRDAGAYVGRVSSDGHFSGLESEVARLSVERPGWAVAPGLLTIPHPANIEIGNAVRLLGWSNLPDQILPGERVDFDLFWQGIAPQQLDSPLEMVALAESGEAVMLWKNDPAMGRYPFRDWQPLELVTDWHEWQMPVDMAAGRYQLLLRLAEQSVELGGFEVLALDRQFEEPAIGHPLDARFGNSVRLIGYDAPETAQVGEALPITVYWQLIETTELPLKVFVHFVDEDGNVRAQRDAQPKENTYPFALWLPGEYVADSYTLDLPADLPPGSYTIRIGLYIEDNGQRLAVYQDEESQGDFWPLATITLEK